MTRLLPLQPQNLEEGDFDFVCSGMRGRSGLATVGHEVGRSAKHHAVVDVDRLVFVVCASLNLDGITFSLLPCALPRYLAHA